MARTKAKPGVGNRVFTAVRKKVSAAYAKNIANKARTKRGRAAMVRKGNRARKSGA